MKLWMKNEFGKLSEYNVPDDKLDTIKEIISDARPATDEDFATFGLERGEDGHLRKVADQ